jgi:sulfite dehydrogenase (cytochrome) subunit B
MRAVVIALIGIILIAPATMLGADDTVSITLPPDHVTLAQGAGRDVTEAQCRMCHSLDYVTTQPPASAAQWQGVVTKMRTVYGAPISDAEAKTISDYLTTAYGPR